MSTVKFRISSALKSIIGKDLITDDFVAIFELVKNSFDAEARNIEVSFLLADPKHQKIIITDDGNGMDEADLKEKWLFVAYSAKKEGVERSKRKIFAGNKGVGRFSCDRLGGHLRIQSKIALETYVHNLKVNWGAFEKDSKKEFRDVAVTYNRLPNFEFPNGPRKLKHGVILEISNLREADSWDRKKLLRLHRSLSKLIPPFENLEDQGKIHLFCDREIPADQKESEDARKGDRFAEIVNGVITNDIFNVLKDKTTALDASIDTKGNLDITLTDRGAVIYRTREDVSKSLSELRMAGFRCQISYLNSSAKMTFGRRMGLPSVQYGSVFLIRNGFLVYPVGEEGDDYWGLDRRKAQGYNRYLGTRELLGFVSVYGNETAFRESSSRDKGLIHTPASAQLHECVLLCIKKLEAYVVDVSWKDKLDKEYSTIERISLDANRDRIIELVETLSLSGSIKVLEYNRDLVGILGDKVTDLEATLSRLSNIAARQGDNQLLKDVRRAEKEFKKAKESESRALKIAGEEAAARKAAEHRAQEEARRAEQALAKASTAQIELEEEKKRSLFLLGSSSRDKEVLEGFLHQIVIYAANAKVQLEEILPSEDKSDPKLPQNVKQSLENLREINEKIIMASRFATHGNFRMDSTYLTTDLAAFVCEFLKNISQIYASKIMVVFNCTEKSFEKRFKPIELGMAIENLIDNAKKARAAHVEFGISIKDGFLQIDIIDNGRGLDRSISDPSRIFEKGFSRTDGSGLGLFLCKQTFESIGGEISLSKEQPKRGAHFIVRIGK